MKGICVKMARKTGTKRRKKRDEIVNGDKEKPGRQYRTNKYVDAERGEYKQTQYKI